MTAKNSEANQKATVAVVVTTLVVIMLLCLLCIGSTAFLYLELPGLSDIMIPW